MYWCISAERRLNWVQNTYLSHESPKVLGNRLSATCLRSIQNMNKRLAHLKRRRRIHQCSSTPTLFRQLFSGISTSPGSMRRSAEGKKHPFGSRETPLFSKLIQLIGTKTLKNATTVCLTWPGRQKNSPRDEMDSVISGGTQTPRWEGSARARALRGRCSNGVN